MRGDDRKERLKLLGVGYIVGMAVFVLYIHIRQVFFSPYGSAVAAAPVVRTLQAYGAQLLYTLGAAILVFGLVELFQRYSLIDRYQWIAAGAGIGGVYFVWYQLIWPAVIGAPPPQATILSRLVGTSPLEPLLIGGSAELYRIWRQK